MKNQILKTLLILIFICSVIPVAYGTDVDTRFDTAIRSGDGKITGGQFKEALIDYKAAAELKPGDSEAHYKIGVANYFLRDFPAAAEAYKKAISLNPAHFKALNNLGMIYEQENRNRDATRMYEQAVAADASYKKALYNLGRILYKRALLVHAEKVARDLLNQYPTDEEGMFLMGLIYEHSDEYEKAREMYENAAKLSTLKNQADESLKRLSERKKSMESVKSDLQKARNFVNFKLPNGFAFKGMKQLPAGRDIITVIYKTGGTMMMTQFPDGISPEKANLEAVLSKPENPFLKALESIGIGNVSLVDVRQADLNNPEEDNSTAEGEAIRKYARITCTVDGKISDALITLLPGKSNGVPVLLVAHGPRGKLSPGIVRIFMANIEG